MIKFIQISLQCSTLTFLLICPLGNKLWFFLVIHVSFWLPIQTHKKLAKKMPKCILQACLLVLVLQQWFIGWLIGDRLNSVSKVFRYFLTSLLSNFVPRFQDRDFLHFLSLYVSILFTFFSISPFIFLLLFCENPNWNEPIKTIFQHHK